MQKKNSVQQRALVSLSPKYQVCYPTNVARQSCQGGLSLAIGPGRLDFSCGQLTLLVLAPFTPLSAAGCRISRYGSVECVQHQDGVLLPPLIRMCTGGRRPPPAGPGPGLGLGYCPSRWPLRARVAYAATFESWSLEGRGFPAAIAGKDAALLHGVPDDA